MKMQAELLWYRTDLFRHGLQLKLSKAVARRDVEERDRILKNIMKADAVKALSVLLQKLGR